MKTLLWTIIAALALAGAARASSIQELASLGYSTKRTTGVAECVQWNSVGAKDSASGFGASADFGCVNGPTYASDIDAFAAGHAERKFGYENPTALQARDILVGKGYRVGVNYAAATLQVAGECNVNETLAASAAKAYADAAPTSAPCPPPAPAVPVPAPAPVAPAPPVGEEPVPAPDPLDDIKARLAALEAKYDELASRVNAIKLANEAAWDALVRALGQGRPAYEAALLARGAGMNAIYELGD